MTESLPKITAEVLEIPNSLVLIEKSYKISLKIQNSGLASGNFKILYEGNGLQIKSSDLMNKEISLDSNSSEIDQIGLIPQQKGLISLKVRIIWLREVIKEVVRVIEPPSPSQSSSLLPSLSGDDKSVFGGHFSSDISDVLNEVFQESEVGSEPETLSSQHIPSKSGEYVEKIKKIIEQESFTTSIYLNAIDKESSAFLKKFAKKGDSNILSSGAGLPFCISYFYSEKNDTKWKIRPALIRDLCVRMKEKFGKVSFYLSYPLSSDFDENELLIIKEAIKTFVLPYSSSSKPLFVLNLDIIPELEKPSIIIGYEKSGIYESVRNLLIKKFGNRTDIFYDDCVFSGGLLYDNLVDWAGSSKARILNIVLSNNFMSDIKLFEELLESLVSFSLGEL